MDLRKILSHSLFTLAFSLATTNCSRELPPEWSSSSPASAEAELAADAPVTVALDEDPPLPGEASDAWIGLEQPAQTDPHAHHHGHGEQPAAAPAPMAEPTAEPAPMAEPAAKKKAAAKQKPKPAAEQQPAAKPAPAPAPAPSSNEHQHHQHHQMGHEGHHGH